MKKDGYFFKYNLPATTLLLLCAYFILPVNAMAATYDATGTWVYKITEGYISSPYCDDEDDSHNSRGFAIITQKSDNQVDVSFNGSTKIATVTGAVYTFSFYYPEEDGTNYVTVEFTLDSDSHATGTIEWEYIEPGFSCWGYDTLEMWTVASFNDDPQFFDTSGLWDYHIISQWVDPYCDDYPEEDGITSVNQNGTTFTYTDKYGIHTGLVSGDKYICTLKYPDDNGLTYETPFFQLSSDTSGSGTISWTWVGNNEECSGGATYEITKKTADPYWDLAGSRWEVTFLLDPPVTTVAIFSQEEDRNTITWVNPYSEFIASGFIAGTDFTVIGSYAEDGGTRTESLIFEIPVGGNWEGELISTWTDGGLPEYEIIPFTLDFIEYYENIPNKPSLTSPSNNSTNVSLTPTLTAGSYSHADSSATHTMSEWQISTRSDMASTVFQKITDSNLLSLEVPRATLEVDTQYYWRVRYYDSNYCASEWSYTYSFTTTDVTNDQDGNGIPDAQELPEGSTVDLDNDDVYDVNQARYKILKDINGNPVGISHKLSTTINSIDKVESLDASLVSNIARPHMPNGLITITSDLANPADEGEFTVYFPTAIPEGGKWYMHNPVEGWVDYSSWSEFASDRKSVTITLKDWGFGDADGIPNKRLVDPGGVGFPTYMEIKVIDAETDAIITDSVITIGDLILDADNCAGDCLTMIVPGTYNITVDAPGYETYVEEGVVISEGVDIAKNLSIQASANFSLIPILNLLLE